MTETIKVMVTERHEEYGPEYKEIRYRKRPDGWHVNTERVDGEGWRRFASGSARTTDVDQLLRKEYDVRY